MACRFQIYYYWAANIRRVLYWMRRYAVVPSWMALEKASGKLICPSALLCSKLPFKQPIITYTSNPVVIYTVLIWNQFRHSFNLTGKSLAAPVTKNHMFTPSVTDKPFDVWTDLGIESLYDLYVENRYASFEQLSCKFNIHKSQFFRYLQLGCFVTSNLDCFPLCPPTSLLDSIFKCKSDTSQIMSRIYTMLNSCQVTRLDSLRGKWEGVLETSISDTIWQKIIQRIPSSSVCLMVIQFKIVHRLHWSKERLSKIKTDLDPTCDRCRQLPATLLHMFWSCPKLHGFWQSIFETFSRICGKTIHPSPLISSFGVVPADFLSSRCNTNTIAFGSLLARRLILFKWKHFLLPTYGQWIREVMSHIHLENLDTPSKVLLGNSIPLGNHLQPTLNV